MTMASPSFPEDVFADAVRFFWAMRKDQANAQQIRGLMDQGSRSAVTGGKQMDGFIRLINEYILAAGVNPLNIKLKSTELPGYFRPEKKWDIVVLTRDGDLSAVIELKSHVGSFGNNFNNRTEEAMGSALDIWTAYREGAFRTSPQPWLGYLLLLEQSYASQRPVANRQPHFDVLPEFRNTSYAQRYELFCRRLVRERHYSSACFLLANLADAGQPNNYVEPAADLGAAQFLSGLLRHVARA